MAATKTARWKLALAYGAFALVAFVVCLVLTFPYDTLRARVVAEAAANGWALRIGGMRPGLFGVTATQVRLSRPPTPLSRDTVATLMRAGDGAGLGAAELGEPLVLQSVALRPSLFPLGVALRAAGLSGTIRGVLGGRDTLQVRLELDGLDATQGNLKGFSGLDLEGQLSGSARLSVPRTSTGRGAASAPDPSQADGEVVLDARGLVVRGGSLTVPMYGQPTPVDVPRLVLGDVTGRIRFEKGLGTFEDFHGKGEDLELRAAGTLKLAKRLGYSEPALDIKLRADPALVRRLGILGSGLSMLPTDKENPEFRVARLTGFLARPNFSLGAGTAAAGGGRGTR